MRELAQHPALPRFPDSWKEPNRAVSPTVVAELFDVSESAARRWLENALLEVAPDRYLAVDVLRMMRASEPAGPR